MPKVLVCDDDEGILEIIKIILQDRGIEVKLLRSGRGIQKRIVEYQPDLILLDLWMPGINGKEVTLILKKDAATKDIPIVIISALNDTKKISKEIHADGFLPKPFDMDDLIDIVNKYC